MSGAGLAGGPAQWLAPGGPVAQALGADGQPFEARAEQVAMCEAVHAALEGRRHLVVEAGTGVGKTFAYLLPALVHAERTGQAVAISTSSIALQEQLVRRDLPLLARALPFPLRWALVKGRGNYLCLRRMHAALADRGLFDGDLQRKLEDIAAWSQAPGEGSRQELPEDPGEAVWDLVKAEHGNCLGRQCKHYAACSYQASRQRAQQAQLVIVNHHLLLSDLVLRRSGASMLPPLSAVVVDEAHDLEEVAAEHLGVRVSALALGQSLGRLWNARQRSGLLAAHADLLLRREVEEVRREVLGFFEDLASAQRPPAGRARAATALAFPEPSPVPDDLGERLGRLGQTLVERADGLPERSEALELAARGRALAATGEALQALAGPTPPGSVRWLDTAGRLPALCSAPVDVGPSLQAALWSQVGSAVLTSATLATGRPPSFAYLRGRLGLAQADERVLGSPFDYRRQVRLVLHAGLPDPSREPEAWEQALPEAVLGAVRATRGGALVLFTSRAALQRCADGLREPLAQEGLELLVQGEGLERAQLLERLRQGGGVLLGLSTFWQGVDVPGQSLRHVIVTRLPFQPPDHPLHEARSRRVEVQGGDAFRDLSLPQAALRLKQGFGRLVRRATDSGRVTILDPRMRTKAYGRVLLQSLPECPVQVEHVTPAGTPPPDDLPPEEPPPEPWDGPPPEDPG
ncbi:MAG: ATP-dependent DNA helicase [Planctomycetia bacterium]